jgi:hypothetical protein
MEPQMDHRVHPLKVSAIAVEIGVHQVRNHGPRHLRAAGVGLFHVDQGQVIHLPEAGEHLGRDIASRPSHEHLPFGHRHASSV